jgi:hypothetical protein
MARSLLLCTTLLALFLALPSAQAQPEGDVFNVTLSPALEHKDPGAGAWLALAGAFGALAVLFPLLGGAIPGTAGAKDVESEEALLKSHEEDFLRVTRKDPSAPKDELDVRGVLLFKRRRAVARKKVWNFLVASIIFLVMGALTAALFAPDFLHGVAYGAGWSAIVGGIVKRKDLKGRLKEKDDGVAGVVAEHPDLPEPVKTKLRDVRKA